MSCARLIAHDTQVAPLGEYVLIVLLSALKSRVRLRYVLALFAKEISPTRLRRLELRIVEAKSLSKHLARLMRLVEELVSRGSLQFRAVPVLSLSSRQSMLPETSVISTTSNSC